MSLILYTYSGHWEDDVFLRDALISKSEFDSIRDIRKYLSSDEIDFDNFDYLIEFPNGSFNSIYRFNF